MMHECASVDLGRELPWVLELEKKLLLGYAVLIVLLLCTIDCTVLRQRLYYTSLIVLLFAHSFATSDCSHPKLEIR